MITTADQIDASDAPSADELTTDQTCQAADSVDDQPYVMAPDASAVVVTRVRQCPRCRCWVPADSFRLHTRRDGTDHRLSYCDECRWKAERERRANISESKRRALVHRSWSDICRAKSQRRSIASIVGRLWDAFGGSSGVAAAWTEALREASAAKRVRAYEGFVHLTAWLAEYPDAVTEASDLSDSELAEEVENVRVVALVDLLQSDPETAKRVAKQCGYRLTESANEPVE